jgi:hypothetical protein
MNSLMNGQKSSAGYSTSLPNLRDGKDDTPVYDSLSNLPFVEGHEVVFNHSLPSPEPGPEAGP